MFFLFFKQSTWNPSFAQNILMKKWHLRLFALCTPDLKIFSLQISIIHMVSSINVYEFNASCINIVLTDSIGFVWVAI
jgi:hypothetical protein